MTSNAPPKRSRCERCGVPKARRVHADGTTYCIRCDGPPTRPRSPLIEHLARHNDLTATPLNLRRST
jgi:hypothetical protein